MIVTSVDGLDGVSALELLSLWADNEPLIVTNTSASNDVSGSSVTLKAGQ